MALAAMLRSLIGAAAANAPLMLTLTALFWAGNLIVGRGIHGHVPPLALSWLRWTLAFAIVLPFAAPHLKRDWPRIRANIGILTFFGTVGVGAFNSFLYIGLNHTLALNALVVLPSGPVLIAIATFVLFGDRLTARQALGIAISVFGVLWMVSKGDLGALTALRFNKGDLWVLAALATWAVYTAYLRKRPDIHWLSFTATTFAIGAAVNTPLFVIEHLSGWRLQPTWPTALAVAYVSIFPSVFAYVCYNRGVELIGANRAGVYLHLIPPIGAALAIMLLGERLQAFHIIGLSLVLIGVALASAKA